MNITNKDALVFLSDENCLLDTSVDKIEIREIKHEKIISVIFKMRAKSHYKNIKITFAGVK